MNWISVKDRLPELKDKLTAEHFLVYLSGTTVKAYMTPNKTWFLASRMVRIEPTHWMPLPEPPKPETTPE